MSLVVAGAAIAIGSSIMSGISAYGAQKDTNKALEEQADNTYATRMEEIRRARQAAGQAIGANKAAVGASNLQFSGSAKKYGDYVAANQRRDLAWRKQAAEMEKQAIMAGQQNNTFAIAAQTGASIGQSLIAYNK